MRLVPDFLGEAALRRAMAPVSVAAVSSAETSTSGADASSQHATMPAVDPSTPDLSFLINEFPTALQSFFATIDRIVAANPVDVPRLLVLVGLERIGALPPHQTAELQTLKGQALRQGKAVGAVIGFFLKFKPYPMLAEIRQKSKVFQPLFGPLLVVDGATVREVFERHDEFTVEPYGVEMKKVMSPTYNGGFDTFVLSTDAAAAFTPDKALLTAVCNQHDVPAVTILLHDECVRRVGAAVDQARAAGEPIIDVVQALARYVPVFLGHRYLGVPVAPQRGSFELTPEMLTYYGEAIDGTAETALARGDGVVPDEQTMYQWIKAAFQHFFNNVQKEPTVMVRGLRSCRLLLAYLLREIDIQRTRIHTGQPVEDTMLTRLVRFQLGQSIPGAPRPADLDPRLVSDLRIAENVMGTIVGAVAGQEEATCRVVDAMMRLKAGEYKTSGSPQYQYGGYDDVRQLAITAMTHPQDQQARRTLYRYVMEALRMEPQGEVLLRKCVSDGARIAHSRPIRAGTLVFVSHGAAMKDVPEPDAFVLNRPREQSMPYGWGRHTCLGQHVSPLIIMESLIALLALEGLERPEPQPGELAFPLERRFGRMQLDENNLYASTFSLRFSDTGTTRQFYPPAGH
jgi:Cytochrome P450